MDRRKLAGLKTYGRVCRTKHKQRVSNTEDARIPLMSWNDLVNKSDSFDKLVNVYKENVKVSECHAGSTDENGKRVKQRRGLSLKKNRPMEKTSSNRQYICPKKSPGATLPHRSFVSCKPYPLISPIEAPTDSNVVSPKSHKSRTNYESFIEVKTPEDEKIVKTLENILGVDESPEKRNSIPEPTNKCLLTLRNFKQDLSDRPMSTPTGQSTTSAMTSPSSHLERECNILVRTSNGARKQQCTDCSPTELQPHVHLERLKCEAFHDAYHNSYECLEAGSKPLITNMARAEIQTTTSFSNKTPPSLWEDYKNNHSSNMLFTQSAILRNAVKTAKNESEATTVPIEISLSFKASCLQSRERLSCSSLQQSLMSLCHQPKILDFDTCFPKCHIKKCSKVGEGTYGEVFAITIKTELLILKVVPFEGDFEVNGATQKKFEDIQNEAVVSRELSDLRIGERCSTFIRLIKTYCIKGEYPKSLLRAWQNYDRKIGSENENPTVFDANQLYMVFVYENGGSDLEKFKFSSAAQVISTFRQICCALAVAEDAFQFEHRDLHWGNVLISKTDIPTIKFKLSENKSIAVRSEGILVRIIDYSICRLQKGKSKIIYTNLSNDDELFTGQGDYQFEIYRMMKVINKNNWQEYNPKTNVYWLGYILEKLCDKLKCCRSKRDERKLAVQQLIHFQKLLPSYGSSRQFADEWENC